jgi:hypothetical protein
MCFHVFSSHLHKRSVLSWECSPCRSWSHECTSTTRSCCRTVGTAGIGLRSVDIRWRLIAWKGNQSMQWYNLVWIVYNGTTLVSSNPFIDQWNVPSQILRSAFHRKPWWQTHTRLLPLKRQSPWRHTVPSHTWLSSCSDIKASGTITTDRYRKWNLNLDWSIPQNVYFTNICFQRATTYSRRLSKSCWTFGRRDRWRAATPCQVLARARLDE